jgi:DNA-binding transcriptional LysR family regulator
MRSSGLTELEAVLAVARQRSFRAAANELDMSTSALSHTVAALESRIGVRLFNRTTRSVSLSEAGEEFVAGVAPALSAIRGAMEQASSHRRTPSGTLRLNTSAGAARQVMTPIILEYMRRYPEMKVDIVTEDRLVDIVVDGFDAGIRLAETVPQDMVAVPLGPEQRLVVVGAPAYFADHPPPRSPADLARHRCIRARLANGGIHRWEFEHRGKSLNVDVSGPLILDESTLMVEAARAGVGLAYLFESSVGADVTAGRLRRVLEDWSPPFPGLRLYYPGRRHVPARLRAMIELIREKGDEVAVKPVAGRRGKDRVR